MEEESIQRKPEQSSLAFCLATVSLLLGLLSVIFSHWFIFGIVAICLGLLARKRASRTAKISDHRFLAAGGIFVGSVSLIAGISNSLTPVLITGKRTVDMSQLFAIEMALHNFKTEYGKFPDVGERVTLDSANGLELLSILLGINEKSANPQNPCGLKFLTVREGKDQKNGLIYDAKGEIPEGLFDSFGSPYSVVLDTDNDGQLQFNIGGLHVVTSLWHSQICNFGFCLQDCWQDACWPRKVRRLSHFEQIAERGSIRDYRNGLWIRSSPRVVAGPWPGRSRAWSGRGVRILRSWVRAC